MSVPAGSDFLPSQFSGPMVQAVLNSVGEEMGQTQFIVDYLNALSIDTAYYTELESIGGIVGIQWPTSPSGIFNANVFAFGSFAEFPLISPHGFGSVTPTGSGIWASASPTETARVPIETYRELLPEVALLKFNGLSLATIDKIANVFCPSGISYTIEYRASPIWDVLVTYDSDIGPGPIYIMQHIFDEFCTDTQVFVGVL